MKERILLYHEGKTYWFSPDDICMLQGNGSYTLVTLHDGRVLQLSKNLKNVFAAFPPACTQFYRVQKSYIVNLNHIEYLQHCKSRQKFMLRLQNGADVPISKYKHNELLSLFLCFEKDNTGIHAPEINLLVDMEDPEQDIKQDSKDECILIYV